MRNLECFGGDDGTLVYYYRCLDCGTIILEDRSDAACLEDWECPTCHPKKYFPFKFITKKDMEENEFLKRWIEAVEFI
jgi:rubrerythrin